jgi:hypothetical protein
MSTKQYINQKKRIVSCCALTITAITLSTNLGGSCRGFGGARGGGGYDRGGFQSGFGRGFDDRADDFLGGGYGRDFNRSDGYGRPGDFGNRPNESLSDQRRPDAFSNGPRVSDADLRASADREYSDPGYERALSTDGGFGRVAMANPAYSRTYRVPPAELADRGAAVRDGFHDYGLYNRNWWGDHPYAWRYPYYGDSNWAWGYSDWPALAGFWGMSAGASLPLYDYGDNITYDNTQVYYGSQPTCSADQYYQQAQTLAQSAPSTSSLVTSQQGDGQFTIDGKPPGADDWKALGVFSLTQKSGNDTTSVFQLCVNKAGIIRGNYTNELTGDVEPVQGAVDKKAMRASWTVGSNKSVVYDTGVDNLLQNQSPILVHFSKTHTEQWTLVRLQAPKNATKTS